MTRETSVQAYHQIQAEGLLGRLQLEVYSAIFQKGPLTGGEVWKYLATNPMKTIQIDSIRPRLAELEAKGVIRSVGSRICNVTKREVLAWDVTGELPREVPKDITESSKQKIARLEAKVQKLTTHLKDLYMENEMLRDKLQRRNP